MINNCAVIESFGQNTQCAAADATELMGFMTPSEFLALERGEMFLQTAGDDSAVARRPKYLTDPIFADRFDTSPMFDTTMAPPPVKTLTRFYLRLARQVKSAEDRLGPAAENTAHRVLAQLLEREAGR